MAQYGWQNTVACVGKWLQSNVWNHLSSGRVWKMTVLCILQKSLLIDFIYLGGGGMVTDGRDNWRKKRSGFFTLSRHPVLVRAVGTFKGDWTCWTAWYVLPLLLLLLTGRGLLLLSGSPSWNLWVLLPLALGTFWKLRFAEIWRGMDRNVYRSLWPAGNLAGGGRCYWRGRKEFVKVVGHKSVFSVQGLLK